MNENFCIVKARKTGNSIALTCPYAVEGALYSVSVSGNGHIVYTPLQVKVRESTRNGLNTRLGDYE